MIEKYKAFAQDIVSVMRKHDAHALDITFRLTEYGDPSEQAKMNFGRGRHGAPGVIAIVITTSIRGFKEEMEERS